jgi:hypothetical protein
MAVAKLKRPREDRFEELAERIAAEINERAAKMTPEERAKADSETNLEAYLLSAWVQCRNTQGAKSPRSLCEQ